MSDDFRTDVRIAYDDRISTSRFTASTTSPARFAPPSAAATASSATTGSPSAWIQPAPARRRITCSRTRAVARWMRSTPRRRGSSSTPTSCGTASRRPPADGYVVEVRIPLQTLRFTGGDRVRMGLVFFRKISRIGVSYAWPEMLPGQWVFDRPSHLLFADLKPRRLVELLPSVTYGVNQARAERRSWADAGQRANVGVSGKFGITSRVTLDGTVNPDFSQVESDAFQVEVNRRFPVFFSGEAALLHGGHGPLQHRARRQHAHRRPHPPHRRSDLRRQAHRHARQDDVRRAECADDHPGDVGDRGDVFADRNKIFTIGRATYALRRSDYLGAILTQTSMPAAATS